MVRVRVALRRREEPYWSNLPKSYLLGDLVIDYAEHLVTLAGRQVGRTATGYQLLFELSENAGRVLTHAQLQ